jgi:hypothetical protein
MWLLSLSLLSCWPPPFHRRGRAMRGTLWGQAAAAREEDSRDPVWQIEKRFVDSAFMSKSQYLFFSLIEY